MIKFIKSKVYNIKSSIILLHNRVKQTTTLKGKLYFNGEPVSQEMSLYFTFFDWLLGIVQYGLMLTLILYWYKTQSIWICPIALGLLYWLVPDFVSRIKEKLRSEN